MSGLERMIKAWREDGWDDAKIWLHRRFCSYHFSSRPDPCRWCGNRPDILYLVPGITPDGRMNWICQRCAISKYSDQIFDDMEAFPEPLAQVDGVDLVHLAAYLDGGQVKP